MFGNMQLNLICQPFSLSLSLSFVFPLLLKVGSKGLVNFTNKTKSNHNMGQKVSC
jgi:hypothetical protein